MFSVISRANIYLISSARYERFPFLPNFTKPIPSNSSFSLSVFLQSCLSSYLILLCSVTMHLQLCLPCCLFPRSFPSLALLSFLCSFSFFLSLVSIFHYPFVHLLFPFFTPPSLLLCLLYLSFTLSPFVHLLFSFFTPSSLLFCILYLSFTLSPFVHLLFPFFSPSSLYFFLSLALLLFIFSFL